MKKLKSLSLAILSLLIFSLPLCACGHKGNLDHVFENPDSITVSGGTISSLSPAELTDEKDMRTVTDYFTGIDYALGEENAEYTGCTVYIKSADREVEIYVTDAGKITVTVIDSNKIQTVYTSETGAANYDGLFALITAYQGKALNR